MRTRCSHRKGGLDVTPVLLINVRQLGVQILPLNMTLVCCRDLPPVQPLMLSAKQGGIRYHSYIAFGVTWPGIEPLTSRPLSWFTHCYTSFNE